MNVLKKKKRSKLFFLENVPDLPDTKGNDEGFSNKTEYALKHLSVEERNVHR